MIRVLPRHTPHRSRWDTRSHVQLRPQTPPAPLHLNPQDERKAEYHQRDDALHVHACGCYHRVSQYTQPRIKYGAFAFHGVFACRHRGIPMHGGFLTCVRNDRVGRLRATLFLYPMLCVGSPLQHALRARVRRATFIADDDTFHSST